MESLKYSPIKFENAIKILICIIFDFFNLNIFFNTTKHIFFYNIINIQYEYI